MKSNIVMIVVALIGFGAGVGIGYQWGSDDTVIDVDPISSIEPKETIHAVSWFLDSANENEFLRIYRACKSNPGLLEKTPNCINAEQARITALKNNWTLAQKLTAIRNSL